ncbi:MAG: iron ABC transporter permease [Armatimonadota bacterium]|nr:iron ABC transporter permease [Armatimonadota bacterium]
MAAVASVRPLQVVWHTRRLWRTLTTPRMLITIVLGTLLAYLVVMPLARIAWATVTWQPEDARLADSFEEGAFTLFHWKRTFLGTVSRELVYMPFINTLVTASGTTLLALAIGCPLAWVLTRTDLPGRRVLRSLVTIPYILPSWVIALAWLGVFRNPRIGGSVGLFQYLTGIAPPNWLAYGPIPIIVCLGLHYYAFAYVLTAGALASVDRHLEESGEILGASHWKVLRRITLPLVLPAVLSAFILTFSRALGTFGTPIFLGRPVRYYTLATSLYGNLRLGFAADAYILALGLIALSAVTVYANQRLIGTRKGFVTIAGRGLHIRPTPLRRWKVPLLVAVVTFVAVCVLAPLLFLVWQSLMLEENDYSLGNLSLHYWTTPGGNRRYAEGEVGLLRNFLVLGAAKNSVLLASLASAIVAVVGLFLGYAIVKGRGTRASRLLEQVAFLPYLIPSIAFGAAYIAMFAAPLGPIPALYGTFALLVLVSVAKNLPFSSRAGVAAMLQIGGELEEAAVVAGASWTTRFRRVIVPLAAGGLFSGFLLTFISTIRELSLIILLVTPATRVLPSVLFRYTEQGYTQFADGIVVILVVLSLAGQWAIGRVRGADLSRGLQT